MIKFDLQRRLKAAGGELDLHAEGQIAEGQLLALYGDSGVGKTSILRMLAGLMDCDRGRIEVAGTLWLDTEKKIDWPPQRRQVGLVFQDYALFPNMTVRENLSFALSKGQPVAVVEELIEMMELGELQGRRPGQLSGGQQQRVALARSLVRRPRLLLLDEPLSALDQGMRSKLQDYVLRVHREYGLTTILVSHDVAEICRMADQVWVLEGGKIVRRGSPLELFAGARSGSEEALEGEVLRIEESQKLWARVGDQIVQLPLSMLMFDGVKVGDRLFFDFSNPPLKIQRKE